VEHVHKVVLSFTNIMKNFEKTTSFTTWHNTAKLNQCLTNWQPHYTCSWQFTL